MKRALIILTLVPTLALASVSNFNEIIAENSQAQREIQQTMKVNDDSTAAAIGPNNDRKVVLENISYYAPTNNKALKFKKEISQRRASNKKEMNRLATELSSMNKEL